MGRMNRRQGTFAGAVLLALAMAACSSPAASDPAPSGTPSGPASNSASPAGPGASAGPATGPVPAPDVGSFGSVPEACAAISGTAVSLVALPKAAATGKDSAEAEQARAELEDIRGRVPEGLKGHFEKLKSVTDDAGQDYSKFNRNEFDSALAPVAAWLEAYC